MNLLDVFSTQQVLNRMLRLSGSGDSQVGSMATQETPPTAIGHGRQTVTTAGTAVALGSSTATRRVTITALDTNTGVIVVGGAGVLATIATRTGTPLAAGDTFELDIDNLSKVYIDATVSGEGVSFTYTY